MCAVWNSAGSLVVGYINACHLNLSLLFFYGCETWSVTMRVEHRPRAFQNRVVREIFWPVKHDVTREWRKLHYEDLYDLYCSPNIVWVIM